ncbi:MAG: hypothetical protein OEZ01_06610 [Candidatus Heimdallarchaeota archaeon]|nr:hypothetical protein [Candidatus Heimdallarchaeota archaeon]MDH5645660.1 hypothetical protein [Candidatus Heimdallarchaeota archaeon]
MIETSQLRNQLEEIGFTKYEIKILIDLYVNGSGKADEIGDRCEINLSRVYENLDILSRKGFITSSNGRPRVYYPENPQIAIENLIAMENQKHDELLDKFKKNANSLVELIEPLYIDKHTQIAKEELLNSCGTLEEAEAITIKLIKEAKKEICIITHVFNWFNLVETHLLEAKNRNCTIKIITNSTLSDNSIISKLEKMDVEVKFLGDVEIKTRGTLTDMSSVIFVIWVNEVPFEGNPRKIYKPQYTTNQGMVDIFQSYFNYLWEKT